MDYNFTFDEYDKPIAEFSMGHEAIGTWFSDELGASQQRIDELIDIIDQLTHHRIQQRQIEGIEYQLRLNQENVEVIALSLDLEIDQELPEDSQFYDEESYAECGLEDFQEALVSWQEFILSA
ncbi:MAG: YacL family protein [Oleispira sp.]|nr:YacL family protein [Oleispira sp.]